MRESLIAVAFNPFSLKQQPIENLANPLVIWVRPELSDGKCVSRFSQLIDFIIAGQVKADFHSVHRHCAIVFQAALAVPHQTRKYAQDVVVSRQIKRSVCKMYSLLKKLLMVHVCILGYLRVCGHSYFPRGYV